MFFNKLLTSVRAVVPYYTNLLSDSLSISSINFDGTYANIQTNTPHNYKVNDYCIIKNVSYIYNISNISYNATTGILQGELLDNHRVYKGVKSLFVTGDYIGSAKVIEYEDGTHITLCIPTNLNINNLSVASIQDYYINNYFKIEDVVNANTIRVLYSDDLNQATTGGFVVTESRVYGGYSVNDFIDRVYKHHTKGMQDVLYIEYASNEMSRDNDAGGDFSATTMEYTAQWFHNADNINIYYISNTTSEQSKAVFINRATREIRDSLFKTLLKNGEIDTQGFEFSYDGGAPVLFDNGQTNLSIYRYSYFLQSNIESHLYYNRVLINRIKCVNINIDWNNQETEC